MTKTKARQVAAQQLRYGHYRPSAGSAWVNCPRCRQPVTVQFLPWQQPSPFLRASLQSHLVEEH